MARRLCLAALLTACACGGSPPPVQTPPPAVDTAPSTPSAPRAQTVDAGKDCVKAESTCGGGVCNVTVKNDCNDPVRCELDITAACDTQSGASAANGADHVTVAAHASGEVDAQANCSGAPITHTEVQKLSCK